MVTCLGEDSGFAMERIQKMSWGRFRIGRRADPGFAMSRYRICHGADSGFAMGRIQDLSWGESRKCHRADSGLVIGLIQDLSWRIQDLPWGESGIGFGCVDVRSEHNNLSLTLFFFKITNIVKNLQ